MSKRLIKIAKELNVGTTTIVEFLAEKGFDIDNKPTSKVTDDMYNLLLNQFSNSASIKEQANQIIIGSRNQEQEDESPKLSLSDLTAPIEAKKEEVKTEVIEIAPEKEETTEPSVEEVAPEPVTESVVEPEPVVEEVVPVKTAEVPKEEKTIVEPPKEEVKETPGLKVLGKIDLDGLKKKPKKKEEKKPKEKKTVAEAPKEEAPKPKVEAVSDVESAPAPAIDTKVESKPKLGEEMVRAKTPQLQGLKIQGKIDINKFAKKKKEKPKPDAKTSPGGGNAAKRKRKRKKFTGNTAGNKGGANKPKKGKSDEITTVSQKEIEEKIKATLARISGGGGKKRRQKIRRDNREEKREKQEMAEMEAQEHNEVLRVTEFISASELASLLDVDVTEVITTCFNLGVIISLNQRLDAEIIELVASEFNREVEFIDVEEQLNEDEEEEEDDPNDLKPRAPIVTVMGHVDHGKTSLLDYIRSANVASGEAGGITQHVGAYEVIVGKGEKTNRITFLDTPGHEAFTAMRARGAKLTDIVVVIVAADDKIMPQTKEAISHAQAAGVPIVFAINKIDKDGADPNRIKQGLAELNVLVEEWGGKYQSQEISAKTGQNIDELLEKILLEAELLDLKANPDRLAKGIIIEASLDKGRGYVTKVLVQNGTLKIGDVMVAGSYYGKVKAMFNEKGKRVKIAGPSAPVLMLGLDGAPQAGDKFKVTAKEQEAKSIATKRNQIEREQSNRASRRISLDEIGRRLALGAFKELNLIVKGDVDGSVEALSDSLIKLSQETVAVNVIHKAVGQIIESDVLLASASDAIIIGFQVRPSSGARKIAEKEGVEIKSYSIIYEAIDEIKLAIEGLLEPDKEEKILGNIEIRETYKISKIGTIAGCYVTDGKVFRDSKIRLIRDGIVVYPTKEGVTAELGSLKRFKDDVKEVRSGMECGLTVQNFNDIKIGDVIEAYEIVEVKQKLK